ncbi:hypothetical protein L1987_57223 [Smallanthus sonchifolius]|uniref:Uncharacterized protein n=1 Tax=Smallanthus sonchifolius TaxID=185202 RepID=A0ACB9DCW0_9ASTR|nr:hypothetical protein L1987_57223 [Smallanthus sonchifolius]
MLGLGLGLEFEGWFGLFESIHSSPYVHTTTFEPETTLTTNLIISNSFFPQFPNSVGATFSYSSLHHTNSIPLTGGVHKHWITRFVISD